MKQADLEKINRLVIDPIKSNWNVKLPDGMVDALVEDLAGYDDATLGKAMKEVRRTSRMRPSIAAIIEACELHKPAPKIERATPKSGRGGGYDELAQRVMRSSIGQKAIAMGVAKDVWMNAWRDGKDDFTEADLERYRLSFNRAAEEIARVPMGPLYDVCAGVYRSMQEREAELATKYGGAAPHGLLSCQPEETARA